MTKYNVCWMNVDDPENRKVDLNDSCCFWKDQMTMRQQRQRLHENKLNIENKDQNRDYSVALNNNSVLFVVVEVVVLTNNCTLQLCYTNAYGDENDLDLDYCRSLDLLSMDFEDDRVK